MSEKKIELETKPIMEDKSKLIDLAAIYLEELHVSGDAMINIDHALDMAPPELAEGGAYYLHDLLVGFHQDQLKQCLVGRYETPKHHSANQISTPLQRLLSHPFIKKVGVASVMYPEGTSRDVARSSMAQRKKEKELRPDELERLKPHLESMIEICEELLALSNGP